MRKALLFSFLLTLIGFVTPAQAATTFSQCMALSKMQPNDPAVANIWGSVLNTNFDLIDSGVGATLNLSVAGSSNVVLTSAQGATDQARHANFNLSGTLTGNITVFWPNGRCGVFSVTNSTSGAFTLTAAVNNGSGSPAGTTVVVPQGSSTLLVSDGTNVKQAITPAGIGAQPAGGATYLVASNNLSDVTSVSTARTNLGLTTTATTALGSSGATVPLNNSDLTLAGNNTYSGSAAFTGGATFSGANEVRLSNAPTSLHTDTAGYRAIPPTLQNGTYQFVLGDSGTTVLHNSSSAHTYTIPPSGTVAFPAGTAIVIVNDGTGAVTISPGSGVTLIWSPIGTSGSRTLARYGIVTIFQISTDRWYISGSNLT